MKKISHVMSSTILALSLMSPLCVTQAGVTMLDDNTIRVVIQKGHPPFKRFIVKKSENPERFYYYYEKLNNGSSAEKGDSKLKFSHGSMKRIR